MVTEAGNDRAVGSLELSVARCPPLGAVFVIETVQVVDPPADTIEGEQATDESIAGATKLSIADRDTPA